MPLDAAVAPKTLTSTLHYLIRGNEKPAGFNSQIKVKAEAKMIARLR